MKLFYSNLSWADLRPLVAIQDVGLQAYPWTDVSKVTLSLASQRQAVAAQNSQYQLHGEMLAAARLNWKLDGQDPQVIFGCYTVADIWTFIRGQVSGIESEHPSLYLESSQEYSGKLEAETIVKTLQQIVAEKLEAYHQAA